MAKALKTLMVWAAWCGAWIGSTYAVAQRGPWLIAAGLTGIVLIVAYIGYRAYQLDGPGFYAGFWSLIAPLTLIVDDDRTSRLLAGLLWVGLLFGESVCGAYVRVGLDAGFLDSDKSFPRLENVAVLRGILHWIVAVSWLASLAISVFGALPEWYTQVPRVSSWFPISFIIVIYIMPHVTSVLVPILLLRDLLGLR